MASLLGKLMYRRYTLDLHVARCMTLVLAEGLWKFVSSLICKTEF